MIHVETHPLTQALHQVADAAVRWLRVLNDPRWNHVRKALDALPRLVRFSQPVNDPIKLYLKGDGAQLLVVLDENQWPSIRVIKQIPDPCRQDAVVNLWAHQALSQLRDVGCPVERCVWAVDAELCPTARVSVHVFGYVMDLYPEPASARFVDGLQSFLANIPIPMVTRLAQWPLATSVTIGERYFSGSRLNRLEVGDLVFWGASDAVALRVHGSSASSASSFLAECQLIHKDLTMTEALQEVTSSLASEEAFFRPLTDATANEDTLHRALAGLHVNVRFEIDGPALTVAQAVSLAPGDVLVLPTTVDHARVQLRCQGRCIAFGELVNVGGQMGVRILDAGGENA